MEEGKDGSSLVLFPQKFILGEWGRGAPKGSRRGLGPPMGRGKSGVSLRGEGHKLTAKFVHSAVEGLGLLGVPVSIVLFIHRSKMSQDSDKACKVQSQTPGRGGGRWAMGQKRCSPWPSLCLWS